MSDIPTDISTLFRYAGVDPNIYRQFRHHPHVSGDPGNHAVQPGSPGAAEIIRTFAPSPTSATPTLALQGQPEQQFLHQWSVFHARDKSQPKSESHSKRRRFHVLAFHSAIGGGGATTILATLARAFSRTGERVLLSDASEFSTMPLYFGGQNLSAGPNTISLSDGAPIQLELRIPETAETELGHDEIVLRRGLDRAGEDIDRVLLEVFHPPSRPTEQWLQRNGAAVIVVTPDVRSAVGIQRVARFFREREAALGETIPKYFLLNKFKPASRFDNDMRKWMAEQLGDLFLPFAIRRDEKVEEALAEGRTILDFAPDSPASEDFAQMVDWLQKADL